VSVCLSVRWSLCVYVCVYLQSVVVYYLMWHARALFVAQDSETFNTGRIINFDLGFSLKLCNLVIIVDYDSSRNRSVDAALCQTRSVLFLPSQFSFVSRYLRLSRAFFTTRLSS